MIIITILTLIAVKSVPSINLSMNDIHFCRISAIILTYCLGLNLNILYLESLGSGQGVYSGLFQVTQVSVTFELFLLLTGSFILFSWPYIGPFQNNKPINDMIQFHWNIYSKLNSQIKFDLKASDYCIIILFVSLGSSLLISSFDLVSLYIENINNFEKIQHTFLDMFKYYQLWIVNSLVFLNQFIKIVY